MTAKSALLLLQARTAQPEVEEEDSGVEEEQGSVSVASLTMMGEERRMLQENLEELKKWEEKVARMESGNKSKEESRHSLELELKRLEERVARIESSEASKKKKFLQEHLEELKKSGKKVVRIEAGDSREEESRHSLHLELDERTEEARQLVLKLQVARSLVAHQIQKRAEQAKLEAEVRIMELKLEKLRCQLARKKGLERLLQGVKELEKKLKEQMEARSRDRLHYVKRFHGNNKLLAKTQEGEGGRGGDAPGGAGNVGCSSRRELE